MSGKTQNKGVSISKISGSSIVENKIVEKSGSSFIWTELECIFKAQTLHEIE